MSRKRTIDVTELELRALRAVAAAASAGLPVDVTRADKVRLAAFVRRMALADTDPL